LTPELAGRISLRQAGGALVAELRKPAGSTVELGLEAGSYLVMIENGGVSLEAHLTLAAGEHLPLARAAFHPGGPPEVAVARGDAPPPAETVSAAPTLATTPAHETTSFKAGFLPRSIDGRTDVDGFSFGFIADRAASLTGMQLSLGYNQVDRDLRGLQLTVAVNLAGALAGAQISAGANVARGDSHGAQVAAGANVIDGNFRGWQTAAGVNVTTGRFTGLQSAAGLNLLDEGYGLQLSGGANVARTFRGAQIGVVNVADASDGFRLGVVNVGRETRGFQLGVVNVAARDDGESFAILNLIGNGIHDVVAYGTDALLSNVGLELGGRHLFTSLSFSYQPGDATAAGPVRLARGSRRWGYGGGIGWRQPIGFGPLHHLDIEAVTTNLVPALSDGNGVMLDTLRVTLAIAVHQQLSILVGAGANVVVATDSRDFDGLGSSWGSTTHDGGTTVRIYPGFLLGLQI
jgi:hypothetical protein